MKRRLLTIAIFLLAGAVVNVAVAWECALLSPASVRNTDAPPFRLFFHRSYSMMLEPPDPTPIVHEWGLPLVAMASKYEWRSSRKDPVLPWHPIWPGFAINTIFYAAILWLFIGGLFALRRFLRLRRGLRRGLCPKCAYPMGESSVCTECGCALPKSASTT